MWLKSGNDLAKAKINPLFENAKNFWKVTVATLCRYFSASRKIFLLSWEFMPECSMSYVSRILESKSLVTFRHIQFEYVNTVIMSQ